MNAVVTLTRGLRPEWLRECSESVAQRLPEGWKHFTVPCFSHYQRARWESMQCGRLVAMVDDDDRLAGDGIRWCVEALEQTGAGIAFTYEDQIDKDGNPLPVRYRKVSPMDVASHPRSLHHLTVIRTDCLDPECLVLAERYGVGIDWVMKAWCALRHGAVQVEAVGYEWRRHPLGLSHIEAVSYQLAMPRLRKHFRSWIHSNARIDRFVPR